MGGMGIDDGFGLGAGPRFVALLKNEGTRLPVLSLAYGAAILAEHDVTVLDLARLGPDDPRALEAIASARPDWVVAATSYAFLGAELRFLERVHRATGASRLLFGYAATHFAGDIHDRNLAEAISRGDPEVAFRHLASGALRPGVRVEGVVTARAIDGGDHFIADLDALPHPRWDAFPIDEYGYFPLLKKRPFLTLLSSRGCPYGCHFCPYPIGQGLPFRARSPESVVAEMAGLRDRHGVRSILFRDPTFTLDMARTKAICRLLAERGVDVEWGIETRLDRMDEEMVDLLAAAGCRSCEFGVDPQDKAVQRASHRRALAPDRATQIIRRMESAGIAAAGLAVIGVPEEGEIEVEKTLDWIIATGMSYVNFEVATPFPGTPLYAQAVAKGWTQPLRLADLLDGDPKLGFNGVIDLDRMKTLQDRALSRFYFRPGRIAKEIVNKDLLENLRFMATSGWRFVRAELGK
jgi:radical SAM superfamily enzyme YgiQ (UPF0313 family)